MREALSGTRAGLGTIGLSLIIVGMLDNAALAPLASVAITDARSWTVRAGFMIVAVAGVLAAIVVSMLPKFAGMRRVMSTASAAGSREHTQCRKESLAALLLISVSWALRGTAVFLLLNALALRGSFPLALGFLCASAASAAVPIGPAGAAMQAGAGATLLALSGVPKADAVAFAVAAQALVVVTGAAVMLLIAAWHVGVRVRPRRACGCVLTKSLPRTSASPAIAPRTRRTPRRAGSRSGLTRTRPGPRRAPCSGRSRRAPAMPSRSRPDGTCC